MFNHFEESPALEISTSFHAARPRRDAATLWTASDMMASSDQSPALEVQMPSQQMKSSQALSVLLLMSWLPSFVAPAIAQELEAAAPGFWKLVDRNAKVEKVAGDFKFVEGPVWSPEGYLLFSDIPANQIIKYVPDSAPAIFREPSGNSNGLTYDRSGRLLICEHTNRRVTRLEADGQLTVLAESYEGKRLNSPNDIVAHSDGTIFFTDPPYGIPQGEKQELTFQGVYKISPDGKLTLLADDFERPNGVALSPDERTLYVDDTARAHVRAFHIERDGSISNGRVLAELKSDRKGGPDGMKVDRKGNLYVTGPGGVWVFNKAGRHLGTIVTSELPANCSWGEKDFRTLYLTARTGLYKIRLRVSGFITYPTRH
jgi:sugar lactone lactonase YvrE